MTDIAIRVDNLSKLYHLGAVHQRPDTLRDALTGWMPRISQITRIGKKKNPSNPSNPWQAPHSDDLWALKDVSFEVKRGEVVGTPALASGASVIGRNGAGTLAPARSASESTLLTKLSHITEPTSNRVGSLLEVGHVSAQALMMVNYECLRNRRVARLTCGRTWSSSRRSTTWRDLSTV